VLTVLDAASSLARPAIALVSIATTLSFLSRWRQGKMAPSTAMTLLGLSLTAAVPVVQQGAQSLTLRRSSNPQIGDAAGSGWATALAYAATAQSATAESPFPPAPTDALVRSQLLGALQAVATEAAGCIDWASLTRVGGLVVAWARQAAAGVALRLALALARLSKRLTRPPRPVHPAAPALSGGPESGRRPPLRQARIGGETVVGQTGAPPAGVEWEVSIPTLHGLSNGLGGMCRATAVSLVHGGAVRPIDAASVLAELHTDAGTGTGTGTDSDSETHCDSLLGPVEQGGAEGGGRGGRGGGDAIDESCGSDCFERGRPAAELLSDGRLSPSPVGSLGWSAQSASLVAGVALRQQASTPQPALPFPLSRWPPYSLHHHQQPRQRQPPHQPPADADGAAASRADDSPSALPVRLYREALPGGVADRLGLGLALPASGAASSDSAGFRLRTLRDRHTQYRREQALAPTPSDSAPTDTQLEAATGAGFSWPAGWAQRMPSSASSNGSADDWAVGVDARLRVSPPSLARREAARHAMALDGLTRSRPGRASLGAMACPLCGMRRMFSGVVYVSDCGHCFCYVCAAEAVITARDGARHRVSGGSGTTMGGGTGDGLGGSGGAGGGEVLSRSAEDMPVVIVPGTLSTKRSASHHEQQLLIGQRPGCPECGHAIACMVRVN
jgi:hypothetical protein